VPALAASCQWHTPFSIDQYRRFSEGGWFQVKRVYLRAIVLPRGRRDL